MDMKIKHIRSILLAFVASLVLFSCSKDDKPNVENNKKDDLPQQETWVIFNGNADWSGGIYAIKENKSKNINLSGKQFYQLGYSAGGRIVGKTLYKLNGATSTELGITKFAIDPSQPVSHAGFLATPTNTYETNTLIVSDTEGYYWNLGAGGLKIQTFNPSSMQRTGEIDFSSLSNGSSYEAAGQLILAKRDDKLYVDIQHGTRTKAWQVKPNDLSVKIAVYNLSSKTIENTTTYKGATNLGLFADHVLWSIDEVTKDLYMVAIGDMVTQTPTSKILRIKQGENQFDESFELKINDFQYPSDFNRLFAHNGKIYTTISSRPTSYYGGGQHGVSYRQDIWYWTEIDATTRKAKRLDIPVDNFYSYQNPFLHQGEIYFLSNNSTDNFSGVTQYNPNTGETKETFRLEGSGRLMGFHIFND